ncbi:ABC-three component system middle component 6 [Crenothrix sp.]|uniref:ABC-three component system middle component 6 n=1 Tax=Crenothrix sp. TaxID=3100433 RepID=UPI00374CADFA
MITIDSDPKLNPINIGAFILLKMSNNDYNEVEIDMLYKSVKDEFNASYDIFVYTLDWLFIAGAIQLNEKGYIKHAIA